MTLGNRVRIGPNCVIRNVKIGDDTEIFANCVLESGDIGAQCLIGPFSRVRPTSTLANGVHIGNFVEVKNSKVGAEIEGQPPVLRRRCRGRQPRERRGRHHHRQLRWGE